MEIQLKVLYQHFEKIMVLTMDEELHLELTENLSDDATVKATNRLNKLRLMAEKTMVRTDELHRKLIKMRSDRNAKSAAGHEH